MRQFEALCRNQRAGNGTGILQDHSYREFTNAAFASLDGVFEVQILERGED